MQCPNCSKEIHPSFAETRLAASPHHWIHVGEIRWATNHMECPACKKAIIYLAGESANGTGNVSPFLVFPKSTGRPPAPNEVPRDISEDYGEACAVLSASPKASAALSRRCLQAILRDKGFTQKDLAPAIQAVLDSKQLPGAIADNVDAIRNIGNFAAHPSKDTNTLAILPVEPHEAEWNLDVLEQLFDFYYVQPEKARQRRAALDAKLATAGKPPMK